MITVYSYDVSGYYVGETIAREDPKSPGHYLMPARTTTDPPPSILPNEVPKWLGNAWTTVEDYRGIWYDVDTQQQYQVWEPDEPQPPNTTSVAPPPNEPSWVFTGTVWERTLEVAKTEKRMEIGLAYDTARTTPVSYDGKTYDPTDVFMLFVLSSTEVGGGMQDVFDLDHNTFQLDNIAMQGLRDQVFNTAKALVLNREQKLKVIDDASDISTVDAIQW